MRLVVVSHACAEPINQAFFARVEAVGGWEVTIVLPAAWHGEFGLRRAERLEGFGGRLLPLPVVGSGSIPLHCYRASLRRVLAREAPDAVYVHHEPYAVATCQAFVANRLAGGAPIGFYSAQNIRKDYPWPFSAAERYVYAHASFAFPVSAMADRVLRAKGYRGPAAVLPLGVDTGLYRPPFTASRDTRLPPPASPGTRSAGAEESRLRVGYVGRMAAEKGPETLLEALELLDPQQYRAVMVGDGPLTPGLKLRASRSGLNGRLTWTGYVPHHETPDVYRGLDVLVVPSRTQPRIMEQFGRTVIEALACGVPVVTSNCGELPVLIGVTGGGWVFPEGDAAALARILDALRRQPALRRSAAERGLESVRQHFDLDHLAGRFASALDDVARRHGSR